MPEPLTITVLSSIEFSVASGNPTPEAPHSPFQRLELRTQMSGLTGLFLRARNRFRSSPGQRPSGDENNYREFMSS